LSIYVSYNLSETVTKFSIQGDFSCRYMMLLTVLMEKQNEFNALLQWLGMPRLSGCSMRERLALFHVAAKGLISIQIKLMQCKTKN